MSTEQDRKRILFAVFAVLLAIHLTLCLSSVLWPAIAPRLSTFYKVYIVPGPFFNEDFIGTTPRFLISFRKKQGPWSAWRNPELENFTLYHQHPWRYGTLKQSVFERFLAKNLARKIGQSDYGELREFKELHRYFSDHYLPADVDSISSVYFLTYYSPTSKRIKSDTLFHLKYKSF